MPVSIKKRRSEGLVSANPVSFTAVGLGSKYARLLEIRARNWASSAKGGAGTDAAIRIKITDNNGDIVYLDAADRDYKTAEVTLFPSADDTATGIDTLAVDQTGATATAGAGSPIVMEGPVTVTIVNGATATDFMTVDLIVEG
jgi:hypothetical protein